MDYSDVVLLSDLDGTLFNSDGLISGQNRAAISEFCENGGLFGVATGRAPYNARQFLKGVMLNAPSIVFNGAAMYDYAQNAYFGETRFVNVGALDCLIRQCLEERPNINIQVYTPDEIAYISSPETADADFLSIHQPCRFLSYEDSLRLRWIKSLLFGTPAETEWIDSRIAELGLEKRVSFVHSSTDIVPNAQYVELMPLSVNKGAALDGLKKHPLLKGRTFIAAGDYWNDAEMLRSADVSVVPENAPEGVRALADRVGPSNNGHLAAHIIKNIIPEL